MSNKDDSIKTIMQYEGSNFAEATKEYQNRINLPLNAFCGPNRTYPCHDEKSVRMSIANVKTFKPENWENILDCLMQKGERFGIIFGESKKVEWYLKRIEKDKKPEDGEKE